MYPFISHANSANSKLVYEIKNWPNNDINRPNKANLLEYCLHWSCSKHLFFVTFHFFNYDDGWKTRRQEWPHPYDHIFSVFRDELAPVSLFVLPLRMCISLRPFNFFLPSSPTPDLLRPLLVQPPERCCHLCHVMWLGLWHYSQIPKSKCPISLGLQSTLDIHIGCELWLHNVPNFLLPGKRQTKIKFITKFFLVLNWNI
jgi:hypothetical protein